MLKMQAKPIGEDELGVLSKVKALDTLRGRYPPEYDLFDCIFEVIQRKLNDKLWVAPRLIRPWTKLFLFRDFFASNDNQLSFERERI